MLLADTNSGAARRIFGFVGRGQMKRSGSDKGKGMGIAGITVGIVFLVLAAVLIVVLVVNRNNCDPAVELCLLARWAPATLGSGVASSIALDDPH